MVSVITATNRPERLAITKECLARQSLKAFEWVVISPQNQFVELDRQVGHEATFTFVADPPKKKDDIYGLNKAMNAGIKASKGELLIRIDDSIWFPPDALEKWWFHYKNNPLSCVSGVGDQYDQLDENGKPTHKIWIDPRKRSDMGSFYTCNPNDWETNYASFPRELIYEIGGWDEGMDKYYAWDNVAVAYRLEKVGAQFFLDQTNESFSYQHSRKADWDSMSWINHDFENYVNQRGVKLDYL